MSPSFKAIVLDLDGTLIDSAPDLRTATNLLLVGEWRKEISLVEAKEMIGDGVQKLVERAFAATGQEVSGEILISLTQRFMGFYEGHEADLTKAYPGVAETMKRLKEEGYALGICTNKPYGPTMAILEKLNLGPYVSAVIGGDFLPGIRKPDPRTVLAVLEGLNTAPQDTLMVGDNQHDVHAAHKAGMKAIVVTYGYSKIPVEELGAQAVVSRFEDLPQALESLA